jgi:hypothetical protein
MMGISKAAAAAFLVESVRHLSNVIDLLGDEGIDDDAVAKAIDDLGVGQLGPDRIKWIAEGLRDIALDLEKRPIKTNRDAALASVGA